jgi:hypothetical protein
MDNLDGVFRRRIASEHLGICEITECRCCSKNICCFGLRKFGCIMGYNKDDEKTITITIK